MIILYQLKCKAFQSLKHQKQRLQGGNEVTSVYKSVPNHVGEVAYSVDEMVKFQNFQMTTDPTL